MDRSSELDRGRKVFFCGAPVDAAMNAFVTGLILGVAGSGHCLAMCGPLVAAIAPVGRHAAWYHAGRAGTYVVLGLVAGLVGATFTGVGLGRGLAFLMAAVIARQAAARWWGSPRR